MMNSEDKLLEYAKSYLRVKCRPDEAVAVTLEQVVGFAKLLRLGCQQDVKRLILDLLDAASKTNGRTALKQLGDCIAGADIDSWGLPDCFCDDVSCVYCGPRIANRVSK